MAKRIFFCEFQLNFKDILLSSSQNILMATAMNRQEWGEAIMDIPVFDTHTHLNNPGVPVPAQTFWDVAHYFWFLQELQSVGYPKEADKLPENERIPRFLEAFEAVRTTLWAQEISRFFQNIHHIRLKDGSSIHEADEAVRESSRRSDWSQSLLEQLNIKKITVNHEALSNLPTLPGVGVAVPIWSDYESWITRIEQSADPRKTLAMASDAVNNYVKEIAGRGIRGMRLSSPMFEGNMNVMHGADGSVEGTLSSKNAHALLTHGLLRALSRHGIFAQLFLGIQSRVSRGTPMAVNDPRRIVRLYPLFEHYSCDFELITGAPQNNMDIAQAARIYPNVHAGALWWYNFRSSTYRQAMQVRLEAVPAQKSCLLASDARCTEWCYIKTRVVKRLLADFLREQEADGWITEADALWVAREWLHDAPARRYL
jgi:hypothetical protein